MSVPTTLAEVKKQMDLGDELRREAESVAAYLIRTHHTRLGAAARELGVSPNTIYAILRRNPAGGNTAARDEETPAQALVAGR